MTAVTWPINSTSGAMSCDLTLSRKSFLPPSPPPLNSPMLLRTIKRVELCDTQNLHWYGTHLLSYKLREHAKRYFIRPLYLHALQFVSGRQPMERSRWLRNYWSKNLRTVRKITLLRSQYKPVYGWLCQNTSLKVQTYSVLPYNDGTCASRSSMVTFNIYTAWLPSRLTTINQSELKLMFNSRIWIH